MTEPASRQQVFQLTGFNGTPTQGSVTVFSFDRRQRVRRAFLGLGRWWGIALLAVFIPVAHFLLVPSFAIYGVVQFAQRITTSELATVARGTCPDCGTEQSLDLRGRWHAPQQVTCRQCGRGLELTAIVAR